MNILGLMLGAVAVATSIAMGLVGIKGVSRDTEALILSM